jgi:hypothetical protein
MSKFTRIINTFKNGLISPRLRGSISEASDLSSAEVLNNFIVDRTGAITKRPGLELLSKANYVVDKQNFTVPFLGIDYTISVDPSGTFGAIDGNFSSTTILINEGEQPTKVFGTGIFPKYVSAWGYAGFTFYVTMFNLHGFVVGDTVVVSGLDCSSPTLVNGKFVITIVDALNIFFTATALPSGPPTVSPNGAYVTRYEISGNNSDMAMWNGRYMIAPVDEIYFIDNKLSAYQNNSQIKVIQYKVISERTVVFTTNRFSFLISLLDYTTDVLNVRKFIIYPYYVSTVLLQRTLGKYIGDGVDCPICPSNFPFNTLNTDPTAIAYSTVMPILYGSTSTSGVVVKSTQEISSWVTVSKSVAYLAGGSENGLVGRFISIPSDDATKDLVFFITLVYTFSSTTITYSAIQCVGGVTSGSGSTLWKISSWGDNNHPEVCGFAFGRLMYANVSSNPSSWWSAALHPNNIYYRQGFMQVNLLQDASSDFSGINYQGATFSSISTSTTRSNITDIFRFGFGDTLPSLGKICWIASRRAIHMGTSNGENQVTVPGGNYSAATYSQTAFGTNASIVSMTTDGDRKIFFLANEGRDIRVIITEDKDFDSLDNLVSLALTGFDLIFTKIEWINELQGLLCLTNTKDLYFLAVHSDTKIQAFSKFTFEKELLDFSGLRVYLKDGSYELVTRFIIDLTEGGKYPTTLPLHGDIYRYAVGALPGFSLFSNKTVHIVIIDQEGVYTYYDFDVPSGSFLTSLLPFDSTLLTTETVYIYTDSVYAAIKTLPIHEGAKFGSSVGDIQRIDRITVLIDKSGPFQYGPDENNLMSSEGITTGNTTKLVSIDFPQSPDKEVHVYIESLDPTPLNISGIALRGVSYSGE